MTADTDGHSHPLEGRLVLDSGLLLQELLWLNKKGSKLMTHNNCACIEKNISFSELI